MTFHLKVKQVVKSVIRAGLEIKMTKKGLKFDKTLRNPKGLNYFLIMIIVRQINVPY